MQLVSEFLERFQRFLLQRDSDLLMALNMPDDITGWGLYEQDDYNCMNDLLARVEYRKHRTASSAFEYNILDVFGNGDAVALICDSQLIETFHDGHRTNDEALRFSFYLVKHQSQLKIRHAHVSKITAIPDKLIAIALKNS